MFAEAYNEVHAWRTWREKFLIAFASQAVLPQLMRFEKVHSNRIDLALGSTPPLKERKSAPPLRRSSASAM